MSADSSHISEASAVGVQTVNHDVVQWRAKWSLAKFHGDSTDPADMYDLIEREGNLLMYGGASCLWQTLIGNGTATAGQALTYFNNTQAAIGVGDSSTAAAATQTNVQAASNKLRKAMDATYPLHTDATTSGAASIVFRSTFGTSDANFAWQEWGVFNSATDATGRMLNRKVESLGTKTSAATWQFTVTLTLA
jgi:hypothetical protein